MKIKVSKTIIPVLLTGAILVYGASKIGESDYNKGYNNTTTNVNQTNINTTNLEDDKLNDINVILEENEVDKNKIEKPVETIEENKPVQEEPKEEEKAETTYINGLEIEKKKVVTANTTVNIRSGASIDSRKISTLSTGNSLDLVYQENDDWYKVKYNGEDAYISAKYSKITEKTSIKSPIEKMIYFTQDSNLYDDALNKNSIMTIPKLEAAPVYNDNGEYYLTSVNDQIGYIKKADTGDLTGTYVIVDISDQTAALYEDNKLIISTPVVTGKPSTPTTKGLHKVWNITKDRYLVGADYKVYVDVMLAFHNGEGLHDAEYHTHYDSNGKKTFSHGWRGSNSFGGEIYKTSGSHGCVNMPHDAAMTMYKNLELGDKVLVKE